MNYKLKCQLTMGGGHALLENHKVVNDSLLKRLDEMCKDKKYIDRKDVEKQVEVQKTLERAVDALNSIKL